MYYTAIDNGMTLSPTAGATGTFGNLWGKT